MIDRSSNGNMEVTCGFNKGSRASGFDAYHKVSEDRIDVAVDSNSRFSFLSVIPSSAFDTLNSPTELLKTDNEDWSRRIRWMQDALVYIWVSWKLSSQKNALSVLW